MSAHFAAQGRRLALLSGAAILTWARPLDGSAAEPLTAWVEALGDAAEAQRAGDAVGAERAARRALEARPRGSASARARLALGLALEAKGDWDAAAALLGRAADEVGPAAAAATSLHTAESLVRSGHPGAAAALLAGVGARTGPLSSRARWREADALLEAGATAKAAEAYERLLAEDPGSAAGPRARLALAGAYRSLREPARAVAEYRRLWVELPADAAGRAAGRELRRWRDAGGPVPEPTAGERLARAERLLALSLPRRVLRSLDRLDAARPAPAQAAQSALLRAMALLQLGRRAEAESLARNLLTRAAVPPDVMPGAQLVLARAAARAGRPDEASAWYLKLAAPRRPPVAVPAMSAAQRRDLAEEAAYLARWLYYDAGQFARARDLLARYARAHPRSRRAEDARWFAAWSAYRLGDRDAAQRLFAGLSTGPLSAGALYWRARLSKGRSEAVALYRRSFAEAEGGWYALLSASRLAELGASPPRDPPSPPSREVVAPTDGDDASRALHRAVTALSLGLREDAVTELRALSLGREARRFAAAIAELAAAAGDAEIPFRMARDHLLPTRRALRWGHPEAYPDVLFATARGFAVDPYLLLAAMRRESSFREEARSGAAAEGLLQLILPTAERLGTVLGVPADLPGRLGEAEVSVQFGGYYVALLAARFASPTVVLAAYNAGPAAAEAWARERAGVPLDEWVEDIPFRETRHYVKTVTADYALYRRLYGAGDTAIRAGEPVRPASPGVAF